MDNWELLHVLLLLGLPDRQVRPVDRALKRLGAAMEPLSQRAQLSRKAEGGELSLLCVPLRVWLVNKLVTKLE